MEMMQYLLDNGEKPFARSLLLLGQISDCGRISAHFNQPSNEPADGTSQQLLWPPNSMTKYDSVPAQDSIADVEFQ
uniref:Uncharacterized protein n=1 Tax=Ditylenchus dipsaci TaxID=166011 RepID=A0A915EM94_9BILA